MRATARMNKVCPEGNNNLFARHVASPYQFQRAGVGRQQSFVTHVQHILPGFDCVSKVEKTILAGDGLRNNAPVAIKNSNGDVV